MMHLSQIAQAVSGSPDRAINGEKIAGVSTDSRSLRPGEIFFALKGPTFDGHEYVGEAFQRGACAAIVDHPLSAPGPVIRVGDTTEALGRLAAAYRLMLRARVAAVTGSNGKTTTKDMIGHILAKDHSVVKPQGSFNNFIGLPLTLFSATPETEFIILELGTNHPGEIARLAEIARPDMAVITSIGEAHLEGLGSLDGIAREKSSLLDFLRSGGSAVVNDDVPILKPYLTLPAEKLVTFGMTDQADLYPSHVEPLEGCLAFDVRGVPFRLKLYGSWNIGNALAASAVAMLFGVSLKDCAKRLEDFKPPKMRMERLEIGGISILNDAYNSNPLSARHAVAEFGRMKGSRKVVIFGDMKELGPASAGLHRELGREIAAIGADVVVTVGPESAAAEVPGAIHVDRVEDLRDRLSEWIHPGDLVLLKGSRAVGLEKVVKYVAEMIQGK